MNNYLECDCPHGFWRMGVKALILHFWEAENNLLYFICLVKKSYIFLKFVVIYRPIVNI